MPDPPPPAIGIDLGTTNSAAAWCDPNGEPRVVPTRDGGSVLPSAVLFESRRPVVGRAARRAMLLSPGVAAIGFKRWMGRQDRGLLLGDRRLLPEDLSAEVLKALREDSAAAIGAQPELAVIAVPAHFSDGARRATRQAARAAGLKLLALLNEPTAAGIAHAWQQGWYGREDPSPDRPANMLVFDLGAGTLDVSLLELDRHGIQVTGTAGDDQLGCNDWDEALAEELAERFEEQHGLDPFEDPVSFVLTRDRCRRSREALSLLPATRTTCDHRGAALHMDLDRERLRQLSRRLLDRCEELVLSLLADHRMDPGDVEVVVPVGGGTRMTMIGELLEKLFGEALVEVGEPETRVACGAALRAATLAADPQKGARRSRGSRLGGDSVRDVAAHSLGFVCARDGLPVVRSMIPRNSPLPAQASVDGFTTSRDDQTTLDIVVVEGESSAPDSCRPVGRFELSGLPRGPAGEATMEITLRYSSDAIVDVGGREIGRGLNLESRRLPLDQELERVLNPEPLDLVLCVDCSGSMGGRPMLEAKLACQEFLGDVGSKDLRVGLVTFGGREPVVRQELTADLALARARSKSLKAAGSTPMEEAIEAATELLTRAAEGADRGQQLIVVITDGLLDDPKGAAAAAGRARAVGIRLMVVVTADSREDGGWPGSWSPPLSPDPGRPAERPDHEEGRRIELLMELCGGRNEELRRVVEPLGLKRTLGELAEELAGAGGPIAKHPPGHRWREG